jgi:hypothetical protein
MYVSQRGGVLVGSGNSSTVALQTATGVRQL